MGTDINQTNTIVIVGRRMRGDREMGMRGEGRGGRERVVENLRVFKQCNDDWEAS